MKTIVNKGACAVLHFFIFFFTSFYSHSQAQGNKSVSLEIGGNGIGFSGNFDMRFKKTENGLGFRAGIGIYPGTDLNSAFVTFPLGINHLLGKGPHHLESGLGVTILPAIKAFKEDELKASGVLIIPSIGYRYAKRGKGFQGRLFVSPLIAPNEWAGLFYFGLSGGFKF